MNQYLEGVSQLTKGQFDSALVPLRAAVTVNQNSARYRGDLAYALAGLRQFEQAGTEYAAAARLQAANPWYFVGLGVVRANQERWTEAGAAFELAKVADSTILNPGLIAAASYVFERGGAETQLYDWSLAATRRFPDDPAPWLRLATLLRARGDTAQGLVAIRRYRALQPEDRLGAAVYALYLYDVGQLDSAVALAGRAAADTALRSYAWPVYLRVGARLLQAKDLERAARVLEEGRGIAPAQRRPQFSLYLGYSNVQRLAPLYTDAVQKKDCREARLVDSLVTSVDHDMHESIAVGDSAQISQILTVALPQFRTRVADLLAQCRER